MTGRDRAAVVVTGLGAITPVGGDVAATWSGLLAGRSGVRALTEDWARELPVRIAATAAAEPADVLVRVTARRLDRCSQFALIAARQAWADAGYGRRADVAGPDPARLGVVIASSMGGITTLLRSYDIFRDNGAHQVPPTAVPMVLPSAPAVTVGLEVGAMAGVHAPVSACASGAEAIGCGIEMIRAGRADVVLAGGAESAIHPLTLAGFAAMWALSRRNDEPERASRPCDSGRDGFVLGEGAGVVVLESAGHAARRGARAYCAAAGYGTSSDSYHLAKPDPDGRGTARAMRAALGDSGIRPEQISHVNPHATGTAQGDIAEAKAISAVLGEAVTRAATSCTKSMTGHLLGAAGAVEAIAAILAIRDRLAPPTINLDNQDDEVPLNIVRGEPRPLPADGLAALSNSCGFGGHNVSLVFRAA